MSSTIDCLVPLFDGTNYNAWAAQMSAFLKAQALWGFASGSNIRPDAPAAADTASVVATKNAARSAWEERDDQAAGFIQLRLSPNLHM